MAVRPTLGVIIFCALAGLILCAIAYGSNHWREYTVDYGHPELKKLDTRRGKMYVSRHYGFFRECFDKHQADSGSLDNVDLYKSPVGEECANPYVGFKRLDTYTKNIKSFVLMKRSYVALYAIGLFLGILGLINICIGCAWVRALPVGTSAVLLVLAACCLAAAGGVWHKGDDTFRQVAELNDRHLVNEYNYNQWIPALQDATKVRYGWSMYIHWIGTGLLLIGGLISLIGCIQSDRHHRKKKHHQEQAEVAFEQTHHLDGHVSTVQPGADGKGPYVNQGFVQDSKMAQALTPYGTYSGYGAQPQGGQAAGGQQYGYNTYAGYGYPYDPYYGMQTYAQY